LLDRLRPLQTVHADFPHTACPDPLLPRHAPVSQLGRGSRAQLSQEVLFRSRVSPSGPPSLFRPMGPAGALRSTGVTPLHRYYGPLRLPTWPTGGYGFPSVVDPDTGSPSRASQVPALICRRPPSRITPRDPSVANARCFTGGIRLRLFRKVGHPHLCNEAERVRFRYG
jgi:hypothetical protein